jgi:hypothetical protein
MIGLNPFFLFRNIMSRSPVARLLATFTTFVDQKLVSRLFFAEPGADCFRYSHIGPSIVRCCTSWLPPSIHTLSIKSCIACPMSPFTLVKCVPFVTPTPVSVVTCRSSCRLPASDNLRNPSTSYIRPDNRGRLQAFRMACGLLGFVCGRFLERAILLTSSAWYIYTLKVCC